MPSLALTRRFALMIPLALAACGGDEEEAQVFQPLRYNDLPPIELKVAAIDIQQRYVPAGIPPDVSNQDPAPPVEAMRAMASDRLLAFGTENRAVFAILNASLTRQGDVLSGSFEVSLSIFDNAGGRLGFATAQVHSERTGRVHGLRQTLYEMTRSMMSDLNVEFEYQVRRNLKPWLTTATAPDTPVQQQPLDQQSPGGAPAPAMPPTSQDMPSVTPAYPSGMVPQPEPLPFGTE